MAKVRIRFTGKDIAVNGKSYAEAVNSIVDDGKRKFALTIKDGKAMEMTPELEAKVREDAEKSVQRMADLEKIWFDSVLQVAMKEAKGKLAATNIILDLAATIDSAEGEVVIDSIEFAEYIRKPVDNEKVEVKEWWIKLRNLFKQIDKPEEVKEPEKTKEG